MKKLVIVALLFIALVACAGCSNSPTDGPTPDDTSGNYSSKDFRAEVTGENIQIFIQDLDEGMEYLYWQGTWEQGAATVVSDADREALDSSLMGSGSDTKEFKVDEDSLGFEFKAMGSTTDVSLDKE